MFLSDASPDMLPVEALRELIESLDSVGREGWVPAIDTALTIARASLLAAQDSEPDWWIVEREDAEPGEAQPFAFASNGEAVAACDRWFESGYRVSVPVRACRSGKSSPDPQPAAIDYRGALERLLEEGYCNDTCSRELSPDTPCSCWKSKVRALLNSTKESEDG